MIRRSLTSILLLFVAHSVAADSVSSDSVHQRMSEDVAAGKPLVAHVVVALCDNKYQGIVPVSAQLGDGDDPNSNLYWGAMYGVRTYFSRHEDWTQLEVDEPAVSPVLDRVAFHSTIDRDGRSADVYVIAEAWQGREIRAATTRFLELSGGEPVETYVVEDQNHKTTISAGGASHLVAYVGHNGLMDFASPAVTEPVSSAGARSSVVLACRSREYFSDLLVFKQSHSLLTTNGLMAPEAYTLETAISVWFSGETSNETRNSATDTYADYQKANKSWSRRLFATDE